MNFGNIVVPFIAALCGVPAVAETELSAEKLIAERADNACAEEIKDLILRRENFLAEAESLPENERSRRATDLAERFESHLVRFPKSFPGMYYFAGFLRAGGENARAEELLLRAERLAPDLAPICFLLAEIFAEKGAVEDAFLRFEKGFASGNPDAGTLALYGEFLLENRDALLAKKCFTARGVLDAEMQKAFRRAAILSGENPDFYWRYAESFYDVETPDRKSALFAWENTAQLPDVKKRPDLLAAIALHRARVLVELGRIDEADTIVRETIGFPELERSRRKVFELIYRKRTGK